MLNSRSYFQLYYFVVIPSKDLTASPPPQTHTHHTPTCMKPHGCRALEFLFLPRNLHSQQSSKTEALESKLQESEKELKAANSLLFERANQIAALQRDVDHKGSRVSALEESLQLEHERQSKLEAQLGVANEKLTSLQSEGVALRQQVGVTLVTQ